MDSIKDKVLAHLKFVNVSQTPTQIGLAIGKDYNSASSSVTTPLKSLIKEGKVSREKNGGKILYSLI